MKKVTKIRMPPACVVKLFSNGEWTFWSGEDERASRKIQTRARHICLAEVDMWCAWFSRTSATTVVLLCVVERGRPHSLVAHAVPPGSGWTGGIKKIRISMAYRTNGSMDLYQYIGRRSWGRIFRGHCTLCLRHAFLVFGHSLAQRAEHTGARTSSARPGLPHRILVSHHLFLFANIRTSISERF